MLDLSWPQGIAGLHLVPSFADGLLNECWPLLRVGCQQLFGCRDRQTLFSDRLSQQRVLEHAYAFGDISHRTLDRVGDLLQSPATRADQLAKRIGLFVGG